MAHRANNGETGACVWHVQVGEQHVEVFGRNVSQGFVHGVNWNHFEPLEFQAFPENIEDVFIVIREKNALFHCRPLCVR
jgi:hypothetical protein